MLSENQPQTSLTRRQKLMAAGLILFGVIIIVLWGVQLNKNIKGPFVYKGNNNTPSENTDTLGEADLAKLDSDFDDLNDWDELNLYKTSPYLDDTDSDGIKDFDEIKQGKNPNCPEGRTCASVTPAGDDALLNPASEQKDVSAQSATTPASGNTDAGANNILAGGADAATLRQALLQAGMDANILKQLSDEDLLKSYQDLLKQ